MLILALAASIMAAIGWVFDVDQTILRFFYANTLLGILVILWAIISVSILQKSKRSGAGIAIGVLLTIGLTVADVIAYPVRMSNWASDYGTSMVKSTTAPDSNFLPRRVLPMEVADQYARSAQTDPQYSIGNLHPTIATDPHNSGRLVWQTVDEPNSILTRFTSGLKNVIEVDADTTAPNVATYPINLPRGGEGNYFDFSVIIHQRVDPLSQTMAPVYDVYSREAIVPLVRRFWGISRYHGVAVFDSKGNIFTLTPQEAAKRYPRLRLYPEDLVHWQAESWGYWRAGSLAWTSNKNILEIADIGDNPAPTLLDDTKHAYWVVPMEPQGASFGLSGLLFFNPSTGKTMWWDTTPPSGGATTTNTVIGPSRAIGIAEGDPRIANLKDAQALEPMLAIIRGQVNWLVPIAPSSRSQIQNLVLVNAHTRDKTVAPTFAQIFASPSANSASLTESSLGGPGTPQQYLETATRLMGQLQGQLDSLRHALGASSKQGPAH